MSINHGPARFCCSASRFEAHSTFSAMRFSVLLALIASVMTVSASSIETGADTAGLAEVKKCHSHKHKHKHQHEVVQDKNKCTKNTSTTATPPDHTPPVKSISKIRPPPEKPESGVSASSAPSSAPSTTAPAPLKGEKGTAPPGSEPSQNSNATTTAPSHGETDTTGWNKATTTLVRESIIATHPRADLAVL